VVGDGAGNDGDKSSTERGEARDRPAFSADPHAFMARLLQYCECPQYLRRHFFPMHPDLQFAGLLPPMDAPHHVRAEDRAPYREGVVLDAISSNGKSLVYCGIRNRSVEYVLVSTEGEIRCSVGF
jgi:methyltransferase